MRFQFESETVVSLEQFFEGNTEIGSIGCNLGEHPGIEQFYSLLKGIRSRSEVQDVLVFITETPEESGTTWAFSDRIYILASAERAVVEEWLKPLQPEPIDAGWVWDKPQNAPEPKPGMKVYFVWWD